MTERSCSTKSTSSKDPAAGSRRIPLHCYRFCRIVPTKIPTDAARGSGSTTPAIRVPRAKIVSGNPLTSPVSAPGSAEFFEHCAPSRKRDAYHTLRWRQTYSEYPSPSSPSRDRGQSVLLDQRQELQRGALRPLLPELPFADQTAGHIQVVRKDGLADMLPLPDGPDIIDTPVNCPLAEPSVLVSPTGNVFPRSVTCDGSFDLRPVVYDERPVDSHRLANRRTR